ncbi:penicillin-binding protein [Micromonospora sp. CPCC 206061]|uniref:penicillin-binding protein n=1 Tax=Micromonospora sp. CPCC 206061 TaxID=3122410 RepID=UPI002FF00570
MKIDRLRNRDRAHLRLAEVTRNRKLVINTAALLLCGVLAGLAVAAAAFPALAMSGLAAKAGADSFESLPGELTNAQAPQASEVYASDNKTLIARFFDENRRNVELDTVSAFMPKAMFSAEDHSFYTHKGVDAKGIVRAFVANSSGQSQQGASTLTMQLVRMSITYTATDNKAVVAAGEDTTARKMREVKLALQAEKKYNKNEIMERYLNLAPFGSNTYGVFAASQFYFGKHPKDLTLAEAAMLAGVVKSPTEYDPTTPEGHQRTLERRNWVLGQMVETKSITAEEAAAAKATPLTVKAKRSPSGCLVTRPNDWGFFCDYFRRWWTSQEAFGGSEYDRERRLNGGGYRVVATLDPKTQKAAKDNVEQRLKTGSRNALMVAAIEPGTGKVRALATNRNFKVDDANNPQNKPSTNPRSSGQRGTYPNTTNPLITGGGGVTGYQFGSTFKIFTIVAALEKGYPLDYTINAPQRYPSKYSGGAPTSSCGGTNRWCPGNDNPTQAGIHNAWTAFGRSVNTYFVPLEERAGAANVVAAAQKMGIRFLNDEDAERAANKEAADDWGAFTLGVSGTTPLDVANAYATLAADGKHCEPIPVQEIQEMSGKKLDVANPRCNQALDVQVARAAIDAARCPVGDQSAFGECKGATEGGARSAVGQPIAGKSGTTDSHRTASLVITTKTLSVAGVLADPDWPETTVNMSHDIVNPAVYETLADASKGKQAKNFTPPSQKMAYGEQRSIPNVQCDSVSEARSTLENAGFRVEVDNTPIPSTCPQGTVADTEPNGRTIEDGLVVLKLSTGVGSTPSGPPPR